MTQFPIRDIDASSALRPEQMGSKAKFWFRDKNNAFWLFKYARPGTGEHWAEKVGTEIGIALGIPCAHVDLATCRGAAGSASLSFLPVGTTLVHGNEILQGRDDTYPRDQTGQVSGHTLSAVLDAIRPVNPPERAPVPTAAECFVGYLLLDALITNGDRHHENWAIVVTNTGAQQQLAPSYDHASSLGRELSDQKREARLSTRDARFTVDAYLARARSAFFANSADAKPLSPLAAFRAAADRYPQAAAFWLARLEGLGQDAFEAIVAAVPPAFMSNASRRFALAMMERSRAALLGGAL